MAFFASILLDHRWFFSGSTAVAGGYRDNVLLSALHREADGFVRAEFDALWWRPSAGRFEALVTAQGATDQVRQELGPEFDDVDWRKFDPRQYDPRRIVREALSDVWDPDDPLGMNAKPVSAGGPVDSSVAAAPGFAALGDRTVPFDADAT